MGSKLKEILKPVQEVLDYDALREEYERKPLASVVSEIRDKYAEKSGGFTFSMRNVNGKWLYFIEAYGNECFWPSYLSAYFYCAKNLWLRHKLRATIVGERGLRGIARGFRVHDLYAEYLKKQGLNIETEVYIRAFDYFGVNIDGYVDILVEGSIPVEVKSGFRELLGHKLQAMLYAELLGGDYVYVVYPHKVVYVRVNSDLLYTYIQRVLKVIKLKEPPPEPPVKKNSKGEWVNPCNKCEIRPLCRKYPSGFKSWDEFLAFIGEFPRGEECRNCPHLSYCRSFKALHGDYPCQSKQGTLF